MKTFKDEFDEIIKGIDDKGLGGAYDNVISLVTIDRMVEQLVQSPELKAELHGYLRGIIQGMMNFEYPDEHDESLVGYS